MKNRLSVAEDREEETTFVRSPALGWRGFGLGPVLYPVSGSKRKEEAERRSADSCNALSDATIDIVAEGDNSRRRREPHSGPDNYPRTLSFIDFTDSLSLSLFSCLSPSLFLPAITRAFIRRRRCLVSIESTE